MRKSSLQNLNSIDRSVWQYINTFIPMWIWIELNSGLRFQPVLLSGFSYLASSAIPAYRAIPHVSSPHFGHFTTQPTSIYSHSPFHVLNTKLEPAFHHTKYSTLKVCAFLEESWTWFKWSFHWDICKIPNSLSNLLYKTFFDRFWMKSSKVFVRRARKNLLCFWCCGPTLAVFLVKYGSGYTKTIDAWTNTDGLFVATFAL